MSLIKCPDCKNSVSDNAVSCPHCGYPIKDLPVKNVINNKPKIVSSKSKNDYKIILALIVVLIVFLVFLGKSGSGIPTPVKQKIDKPKITTADSIKSVTVMDSINKHDRIEEAKFLKTKAGKIYKKHPDWSKEDCIRLANNRVWIGMHYDMLVYRRGKPNHINTSNYGNGSEYQACWDDYNPGCFYFGENNIITSYN